MTGNLVNSPAATESPDLTTGERQALAAWAGKTSPKLTERTSAPLARLIQPILAATASWPPIDAAAMRNLLLRDVHQRQRPDWAWDEDTWLAVAGPSWRKDAAPRPNNTRRLHVFALGHRLGGQRRLHARAGAWRLRGLADLLYGTEAVQAAIDQVVATLASWGGILAVPHTPVQRPLTTRTLSRSNECTSQADGLATTAAGKARGKIVVKVSD